MSIVTDVMLLLKNDDSFNDDGIPDPGSPIDNLNQYLMGNGRGKLKMIDHHHVLTSKAFQSCVFIGGVNHLDISEFLDLFHTQKWQDDTILVYRTESGSWRRATWLTERLPPSSASA